MTERAAEPLLKTKLFIPQVRHEVVKRPRLVSRMNAGIQRALTLVSAPAGFGKTTALAEWADQLQVAVAWVSLDEGDNDLARFFTYLTAALQAALPGAGEAALMAFRSPQPPPVESVLTELINEIAAGMVSFALVLDDYHVIKARPVHDAIAFLIEHMPAQMHLVIASRTDPPLPLARLRGRMQLAELRAADLRFTTDEVVALLNQVMGLNLSGDDVAALEARTEGWIVGLQLAALSMQGREDIPGFIAAFTGSHHYVLDYLAEEVLHRQPENVQTFLLHTSILDRLCGSLCDALLDEGGHTRDDSRPSQAMLEYLEQSNLFIVSLDDERKWYRYHHLFADLLRARLPQSYGDQYAEILHTRAAGWYEANGFPAEAIQHALAAQDYDRAARVVENISERAWLNGEFYRLLGWIKALPGELIRNRPWLCIWYAWALLQSGLVQEVEALINDAERMSENQLRDQPAQPLPDTQALMEQIVTLRVIIASLAQDPHKTIELASRALERSPLDNRMASFIARCNILTALGFAYYVTGELSKAEQAYQEATRTSQEIGFLLRYILGAHKLAHIHQVIGRLHQPYHLYQETLAFMQKQGKEKFFGVGYLYCGMSNLLYEWNRLGEAQQMIAESLRINETAKVPHLLIDSYNAQARLLIAQRDLDAAQSTLQKATHLIQKYYCWPEVIGANESYQVRLWLAKGDLTSAIRWIQERQLAESEALRFARELGEIARARVLIAQGLLNEATSLLDRLAKSAETGRRNGRLIEILVLEAVARQARGELKQAISALEQALSLAEPEGYVRTFVDEGAPVAALLSEMIGDRRSPHAPYVHRLLAAFGIEVDDQGRTVRVADLSRSTPTLRPSPWVEPLSERELEVLQCIAAGLSNAEIAQRLVIAVSTVKRHINHIFGKLGVTTRTQALVKAKELGLL